MTTDRRKFLQLMASGAVTAAALPESIARALAIPANYATGTIADVEHIVILMQENRSFDHYFGTLQGVRGYGDPHPVTLSTGKSVWYQPDGEGGYVLPFHPTAPHLGLQFLGDLAHDWTSTHAAWNAGAHDQWVPNKSYVTMAHYKRDDIPFHYALADAFTICDAYHCSIISCTDPNRYHMWTGWVGNDGKGGGPVLDNAEAGYDWRTYPELLQKAGITWTVYQDVGDGLTAAGYWGWTSDPYIGNYGDNSLLYFFHYQDAKPGTPLAVGAKTGTNISEGGTLFDILINDVKNNTLPQVSWIVAPEAFCEHPNWPPNYGAWYISQVLDALTSNPEVWSKTALFITYDENDGFFDHAPLPTIPPSAAQGQSTVDTVNEMFEGNSEYGAGPIGLGVRVPMIVVSPWSKGGFVNSQVFDHTSLIRFIETRFGATYPDIKEHNITPWRRAVAGDLTSAFNFKTPNTVFPPLPGTAGYAPKDALRHADYWPVVPATQHLPKQEPGIRFARPVPYELYVTGTVDAAAGTFGIEFVNKGTAAAWLQARSLSQANGPWAYTVGAGHAVTDSWTIAANPHGLYDLSVFGPNGFTRYFKGSIGKPGSANLKVTHVYDVTGIGLTLTVKNLGAKPTEVTITDKYTGETVTQPLAAGQSLNRYWALKGLYGWYDLTVTVSTDPHYAQRLAGHVETGKDSATDPAIGGLGSAP